MGALFGMLLAKVTAVVTWFLNLFLAVFVALWLLGKDAFSWLFDQVLTVAISAIGGIDVAGLNGYVSTVGTMPAQILNILSLLGIGTAISIIASAITVRLVLQLIPFTRLGS